MQKSSIADIRLGSEYASDSRLTFIAKSNAYVYFAFAFFKWISSIVKTPTLIFLRSTNCSLDFQQPPFLKIFSTAFLAQWTVWRSREKSRKCEQKIADTYKSLNIIKRGSISDILSFLDFRVSQISNTNPIYKSSHISLFCSLNT